MGKLYLVATPIGNLEDVSQRALRILQEVHMVACEDTRHTQLLLRKHEIRAKHLTSYTEFNHRRKAAELIGQLDRGWDVALVTDAGTPGLSDPGEQLVSAAVAAGHEVVSVPGPAAAISALVASGLPTREFTFVGFHEEIVRGTAADLAARYAALRPKGEITVVVAPAKNAGEHARGEERGPS